MKSDSVEVVLCGARRGERLFVAPIREDGTFLLSGNSHLINLCLLISRRITCEFLFMWRRIITFLLSRRKVLRTFGEAIVTESICGISERTGCVESGLRSGVSRV